jgi:2'-5' RNA ligase
MPSWDTVRAFVALNVEIAAVRRIAELAQRWRTLPGGEALRWVAPTRLHVTLKFLGDIDVGLVPPLRDGLLALSSQRASPRVVFQGLSAFPALDTARVLFAEVLDTTGEVRSLSVAVEDLAASLGFARTPREYVPHMTVARTSEATALTAWVAAVPAWRVAASASEIVLYRSDLARPHEEYDTLGRYPLEGRRGPSTPG